MKPVRAAVAGLLVTACIAGSARAASAPAAWPPHAVHLSAAAERMLRERLETGEAVPAWMVARFRLDLPEDAAGASATEASLPPPSLLGPGVALDPDARLNDKSGDASCAYCSNRPLGQAETTIAALGDFMIGGWNDTQGFCTGGAVQGYAVSTDGGATWTDAGEVPPLPSGGRYRGDPVHGVNRKTGAFYICGLYEGGVPGSGLALLRGHFAGGAFVVDDNRQIAFGDTAFLDKDWFAVDSLTGNLYVTYTRFTPTTSWIELIRSTDDGVTWSAPIVMNAPAANDLIQGSRPAVGPDGEVYVAWYEYGVPQSHMRIRRSDDFGASFGAEHTVCDFYENYYSGAPGYRRPFGIALPGIAVDASRGPFRGRVHVTWDESVNFLDAPFTSLTAKTEVEPNGFFSRATPFTVGDVLRGGMLLGGDVDLFRFIGVRGQTFCMRGDSASNGAYVTARIVSPEDTSGLGSERFLAFTEDPLPSLVVTLPADDVYYLMLKVGGGAPLSYVLSTTWDTPSPGERARDHRDHFIAHSDDGASWSPPVRLNDDPPWFDGVFPEVTVDGTGAVHVFWHDFRDHPYGAESYEYMTSSGDGGVTWGANRRVSDASSFWSYLACGSANQGDYQGITSDGTVVIPCWADARLGDPDVFADAVRFDQSSACPAPVQGPPGSTVVLSFALANAGSATGAFDWRIEDDLGWLTSATPGATGSASLAAAATQAVKARFALPVGCAPQPDTVRFVVSDPAIPGRADTCVTTISCGLAAAVANLPAAFFELAPPHPNPAGGPVTCAFSLSRAGPARIEVFDLSGARVRTLGAGVLEAGAHEALWDGRDAHGARVGPGIYFIRLEAEGRTQRRRLAMLH